MNKKLKGDLPPRRFVLPFAAILVLLTGLIWFYTYQSRQYNRMAEDQLSAIARLKASQITAWRKDQIDDASLLLENPVFVRDAIRVLKGTERPTPRLVAFLTFFLKNNEINDILLVDAKGRVRLNLTGMAAVHHNYKQILAAAFHEHAPILTNLHAAPEKKRPHIGVVAPLYTGEGQNMDPVGAVVLVSDASRFLYPLLRSWPTPSRTAETFLVARDGDTALFLNDLRHKPGTALKLRIPLSRTDSPAVTAVLGRHGVVEGMDYRGMKVMASIVPVPDSSWALVTKMDTDEFFAPWRFRMLLFLAVTGCLAALGLAARQRAKTTHYRSLYLAEARLHESMERHSITLKSIGDAIISTDPQGRVDLMNPVAEELTGWTLKEAVGRPLNEIFPIISEETRESVENPVNKVLRENKVVGLANHTLLIARDGREIPIADSAAPIFDNEGEIVGVVLAFREQSEERRVQRLLGIRLTLLEYAATHSLNELLSKALDMTGGLLNSPLGFYHFVEADQNLLCLQQWSSRTLGEFCNVGARGMHYNIDAAGVWADCVRKKKPVVHNDYESLPGKKGLPEGHAPVVRELVVPIIREDVVVAVLGVGNKPEIYTEGDVETIAYLADVTWEIIEKKRAEEALRESEAFLNSLLNAIPIPVFSKNREGKFIGVNRTFEAFFGNARKQLIGKTVFHIYPPEFAERCHSEDEKLFATGGSRQYEARFPDAEGAPRDVICNDAVFSDAQGNVIGLIGTLLDITQRKQAEEAQERLQAQLNQAIKMESVGRLAGGVAHDFNNMLGVILGHADMALAESDPNRPLCRHMKAIRDAAERSADLTRQLLAFARKQTIAPRVLILNETVGGMLTMLRRLIGEDVRLDWIPSGEAWSVKIDPTQLHQVLANMCVNARDAITGVGNITIETANVVFDEEYCAHHAGFVPGKFVQLAVSDDGRGMDRETLSKIFDPFFTTKGMERGTGLGLPTVYGIVKQNSGFINVYSEPGRGTTFRVYFPRHDDEELPERTPSMPTFVCRGKESILLVEDEPAVLEIAKAMLEGFGYSVIPAGTPGEALRLAEEHAGNIHLLMTDVVMPEMNGKVLADRLVARYPGLRCLFMSGYTADVIAARGVLEEGVSFIEKPFSPQVLAAKVRQTLDEGNIGAPSQ